MNTQRPADALLLTSILLLTAGGFLIFLSAAMGLVARDTGANFTSVVTSQTLFGLIPGLILLFTISRIPYHYFKKYSLYILLLGVIFCILVFVPGLGWSHGGATRWLRFGSFTFQASEILKIGVILYLATWYSNAKSAVATAKYGLLPLLTVLGAAAILLVLEPDIDTLLILSASAFAVYFVAGARWKHIGILAISAIVLCGAVIYSSPYIRDRLSVYLDQTADVQGSGYQIKQSLIAIGSGGFTGKGFGQSIQKFNYLPEAIGDSIFAVASEEFGFIGGVSIILAFVFFASKGLVLATHASDPFAKYALVGIVMLIVTQSFDNIGAMLNIFPLSGIPLAFVSQGGSALLVTLMEAGMMLSISRAK